MEHKQSHFIFIGDHPIIFSIRRGLMLSIPLLMIGSFSLVLKFLPVAIYQSFIKNFASGFFMNLFSGINTVTFGLLSVCIVICISYSYVTLKTSQAGIILGGVLSSLCVYMIFVAFSTDDFNILSFGAHGMFTAIFSASVFTAIYMKLVDSRLFSFKFYTVGADVDFNIIISVCFPAAVTVLIAFFFNQFINYSFSVVGLEALFHKGVYYIFNLIDNNSLKVILYVAASSVFWLMGVHGTNTLFSVEALVFGGGAGILTKEFLDVFVLMGGSGTTISLWLAIMLFSRQNNTKGLGKYSTLPMLFNINEIMVFGLPIVFNTTFIIPFLMVPLICILVTYLVLQAGLVPLPVNDVNWVTPVIINGYHATGSILGSILQIFNILLGAFIYRYYLIKFEIKSENNIKKGYDNLIRIYMESEKNNENLSLLELPGNEGAIARILSNDLHHIIKSKDRFSMYYQPQYGSKENCIGAEALLRWKHPRFGMIYPPLIVAIAAEAMILSQLEMEIFNSVCQDIMTLKHKASFYGKISVNITAVTLYDDAFIQFLREIVILYPGIRNILCIELTEQMSFSVDKDIMARLNEIRSMDIRFAIDDFSMGHTSIKYLQSNLFDLVKLDGSLVKDMMVNARSEKIVFSIIQMSESMHFNVLAEYVENINVKEKLETFGCHLFQGYLYSPAIPLERFMERIKNEQNAES